MPTMTLDESYEAKEKMVSWRTPWLSVAFPMGVHGGIPRNLWVKPWTSDNKPSSTMLTLHGVIFFTHHFMTIPNVLGMKQPLGYETNPLKNSESTMVGLRFAVNFWGTGGCPAWPLLIGSTQKKDKMYIYIYSHIYAFQWTNICLTGYLPLWISLENSLSEMIFAC